MNNHCETGIKCQDLVFEYPGRIIWQDLSFTIGPGELTALLGESGSGKTTLLQCLGSLERPSGGTLEVCGQQPGNLRGKTRQQFRRDIVGFAFQNAGVVASWSVKKNIEVGGYRLKDDPEAAQKIFAQFDLPFEFLDTPVYKLSGGEQQRVSIIRLALKRPKILLMDEPSSALDDENTERVTNFLNHHCTTGGIAVVATHDARIIQYADNKIQL